MDVIVSYWSKSTTVRSWERRRHKSNNNNISNHTQGAPNNLLPANTICQKKKTFSKHQNGVEAQHNKCYSGSLINKPFLKLSNVGNFILSSSTGAISSLALLVLFATSSSCTSIPCESHNWWDPVKDKCIPCTVCHGELIPLRPCQLHRDTVCGSIYDLKIDWVVLAKTEPNWKERRKFDASELNLEHLTNAQLQQLHDETVYMDWQNGALFFIVLACLLFFIVAAFVLIYHIRQWRRMERRLDHDVEELSTKLMAKLAEVQSVEGGTFLIGNADVIKVSSAFPQQLVLLPDKALKYNERRNRMAIQPGNVYIEENTSKG